MMSASDETPDMELKCLHSPELILKVQLRQSESLMHSMWHSVGFGGLVCKEIVPSEVPTYKMPIS